MKINTSRIGIHAGALAAYAALAVVLLGPLDMSSEIWGNNTTDVYTKLNLRAWQASEAARGTPLPLHTDHLLYPDGSPLFMADPVGGVLVTPVVWVLGPMVGYNVLLLGNLVFGCWSMFWLVGRLQGGTRDRWAALLAGAIYGLCPLALGHINNGVTEIQQIGWLPLFVGALLALYDDARAPAGLRRAALLSLAAAAAWWFASVASHWYFGMFASGLFVLLLVTLAAHARDRHVILRLLARFAAAGIMFTVLVLPVVLVFLGSVEEAGLTRGLEGENANRMRFRADLAFLFASRAPENPDVEVYLHLAYLGFAAPLLALVGLWRAGVRRAVAACLLAAAFFALLSFGPDLMVHNHNTNSALVQAVMPYTLLSTVVPFFGSMDFPYRFFLLVHLFVALAVGLSLSGLVPRLKLRVPLYLGAMGVVLLEVALLSGVPWPMARQPISAPKAVADLARVDGQFAVFDLPVRFDLEVLNRYTVNQVFHRRPIVYCNFPTARYPLARSLAHGSIVTNALAVASDPGRTGPGASFFQDRMEKELKLRQDATSVLRCLLDPGTPCEGRLLRALGQDLRRLHRQGITRFVVHYELLGRASRVRRTCAALFGPPASRDAAVSVHLLKKNNRFMR